VATSRLEEVGDAAGGTDGRRRVAAACATSPQAAAFVVAG
jgi:hypothetical protein